MRIRSVIRGISTAVGGVSRNCPEESGQEGTVEDDSCNTPACEMVVVEGKHVVVKEVKPQKVVLVFPCPCYLHLPWLFHRWSQW